MDGIIRVDKPRNWTSFDVVAKVRAVLRQHALVERHRVESEKNAEPLDFQTFKLSTRLPKVKVGHTGTLDPLATGLLVLTLGSYCKRASELSKLDKTYEVTMRLGETSTTGDEEGTKQVTSDKVPSAKEVNEALERFVGEIMQTPPAHSAIKVNGQRAYKLARAGKPVELETREVTVHSLQMTEYSYPEAHFTVCVSSGTYVRSLVEDIGEALGTGAYMSDLRRTSVGDFTVDGAMSMEDINPELIAAHLQELPEVRA